MNDYDAVMPKRALKKQGFLERMRNKMEHDLSKHGWDD